ncbi:hypothetical protein [Nonomuraea jabiensis]|uniref:hypothetical protein n=1 Tax=Nonomuraea jabiensis TaxID=882448 RepID=UPI003D73CA2E
MLFELAPPFGAGPIRIGMSHADAHAALEALGTPEVYGSGWVVHRPSSGASVFAYFDKHQVVEAIEIYTPVAGTDEWDRVLWEELDVFATPAEELVAQFRQRTTVIEEQNGHSYTLPKLLLAFWRSIKPEAEDDPGGRQFESVLIARPGYYDGPATTPGDA